MQNRESCVNASFRRKGVNEANLRIFLLVFTVLFLSVLFGILNPIFFRPQNLMNMVSAMSVLAISSIGMSLVIMSGGLDLSMGSVLALSASCTALVLRSTNNALLGFLTAVGTATLVGTINGFAIGTIKLNAVVFTLGMMAMARSFAQVITSNTSIKIKNGVFNWLGGGSILTASFTIPIALFVVIIFYVFFVTLFKRSVFGRKVNAIGGNSHAARIAGIPVEKTLMIIYVINGLLIGVATIIDVGRVSSSNLYAGAGLEFNAITAVIIGGASLSGGKLDLRGTILGVIIMGIVISGLALLNIYVYYLNVIKGSLLFMAVLANILVEKHRNRRMAD
jgi:ribose transport system permease protein